MITLNIDRIEVLMGPQGTLYGRLSTAGVVNVISKDPTDKYEASGLIEFGNYSLLHTDSVFNAPLNEEWSVRAAFRSVVRDGYLSSGQNDKDEKTGRIKTRFAPNDDLDMVFTVESTQTGGRGTGTVDPFVDEPEDPWLAAYTGTDTFTNTKLYRYGVDLSWDLDFAVMTFTPQYRDFNLDMGWILLNNFQTRYEKTEETNAELRFASPDDSRIKWLMGLYFYNRDDDVVAFYEDNYRWRDTITDSRSKAIFGNVTYPVLNRLRLNGGLRFTEDDVDEIAYNIDGSLAGTPTDNNFTNTDYKIGFEYDVSEGSLLWGDFSTGFRAGNSRLDPEYLDAFQLGTKSRFLNNALQLNWTAFYYDYQGYQSEKTITYSDGTANFGAGSGDAEIFGVDVQSSYILTEKDRLDLSVSYLDASYTNVVVEYEEDVYNPVTGLTEPDEYYSGATMTNSPEWTIALTYEHSFYLQNGGALKLRADTRYQTESTILFAEDPTYDLDPETIVNPDYHLSNAALTYISPDSRFSLSGYIKNIEDFPVKNHMLGNSTRIGPPRTYAIQLTIKY